MDHGVNYLNICENSIHTFSLGVKKKCFYCDQPNKYKFVFYLNHKSSKGVLNN